MKNTNQYFFTMLFGWFLLNLGQAIFTPIHNDEVYYAIWGKYLDWGYFDHPPAVAVLTWLGSLFFDGVLGVRFFTLLFHIASLVLIWVSIGEKYRREVQSVWVFFIVVAGLTLFSVYAFTTTPDVPLIFFASLFLFAYRKFLERNSWFSVFLLSVAMAGMMYSKYHSALFIGLVVLSNLKLLLRLRFWLAGIFALILFIPHLWWQYSHDFLSFKFHLVSRSLGFEMGYLLEFIPGQLGVFNPFILGLVIFVLWKNRSQTDFDRTLYFLIIGVIGFFALTTLRGRAEAHWTTIASIPMIVLLVEKAMEQEKIKKYIFKYVVFSLVLVFSARVILLTPFSEKMKYIDKKEFYQEIGYVAGETPVVFNASFQYASGYEFYTNKFVANISAIENRQTQYDFWQREQDIHGKRAFIVFDKGDRRIPQNIKTYHFPRYDLEGFFIDDFQTSNRLLIHYDLGQKTYQKGDWVEIPIEIENPTVHKINFKHKDFPLELKVVFLILKRDYVIEAAEFSSDLMEIKPNEKIRGKLKFQFPKELQSREYKFSVIIQSFFGHTLTSPFETIEIK